MIYHFDSTLKRINNKLQMGACLQFILGKRSKLKKESVVNYQQLEAIIKPSTHNDNFFFSSHNLSSSEEYLGLFAKNSNMQPNHQLIDKNINTLINFIRDLRDKSSPVGMQYVADQEKIQQYIKVQSKKPQFSPNNIVILKLEIQILLISLKINEEMKNDQWDYFIEIQEVQTFLDNNNRISYTSTNAEEKRSQLLLIECFKVRDHLNNSAKRSESPQNINHSHELNKKMLGDESYHSEVNQEGLKKVYEKQNQLQQIPFFSVCSKVVNKYSKICISLTKDKRSNLVLSEDASKQKKINSVHSNSKTKIMIGQTNLLVTDFIYHTSLTVSDVVNLSSPSSIKSSSSSISSQKNQIGAFIALRGQGIQVNTFDKDYIKIIKQHQTVVKQLQLCLEGQKNWQKLSEYKNSNGSQRGQSLYSDYESALGMAKYKP